MLTGCSTESRVLRRHRIGTFSDLPREPCASRTAPADPRRAGLPRPQSVGERHHHHQRASGSASNPCRAGLRRLPAPAARPAARERAGAGTGTAAGPAPLAETDCLAAAFVLHTSAVPGRLRHPAAAGCRNRRPRPSRWLLPEDRPRQDRCRPRQSPTSGRTWRTSYEHASSDCPRRGSGQHQPGGRVCLAVAGRSEEEVEDTEMVHAVMPRTLLATIREILVGPADVSTPAKFAVTFASYVRIAVRFYAAVMSHLVPGRRGLQRR